MSDSQSVPANNQRDENVLYQVYTVLRSSLTLSTTAAGFLLTALSVFLEVGQMAGDGTNAALLFVYGVGFIIAGLIGYGVNWAMRMYL